MFDMKDARKGGNTMKKLDEFTVAYVEAALWSTNDESNDQGGDPLDKNYAAADIAPETMARMVADCTAFQAANGEHICDGNVTTPYSADEQAGHDFWLTRNGHGAGFFDGDWDESVSRILTDAASAFGEFDLYVGDDGKIYS
jgi:hypothetical protein